MTLSKICSEFGVSRSTVQISIRTLRNCGILQLDLKEFEKITVQNAMNEEIKQLTAINPHFGSTRVIGTRRKAL